MGFAEELRGKLLEEDLLLCLLGPTAVGKTELTVDLAQRLDAEVISADSRQVYRYMDIGTAKPSPQQRALVPHHVIDCVYPDERFSAAEFQRLADKSMEEIKSRGKLPILVGGTGLYFRALVDGLFEGPEADDELRERLRREAERSGSTALYERLVEVDPEYASRIHPNDLVRIVRALEVYEKTGQPISRLQRQWKSGETRYRFIAFCLIRDRDELYGRIERRVDRMIQEGFVDEVRRLLDMGYSRELNSMRTFGYRELASYLCGEMSFDEAVELTKRRTRQYARRQIIWFRGDDRLIWINAAMIRSGEDLAEEALRALN
jgi:tRNA dimethylallyltransferase